MQATEAYSTGRATEPQWPEGWYPGPTRSRTARSLTCGAVGGVHENFACECVFRSVLTLGTSVNARDGESVCLT